MHPLKRLIVAAGLTLATLALLLVGRPLLGTDTASAAAPGALAGSVGSPVQHVAMRRDTIGCLSATWLALSDGGAQPALLAADGGIPVPGKRYLCTATQDGCFVGGGRVIGSLGTPSSCSFGATFFASSSSFEVFTSDSDAGPAVVGMGISATTVFTCCPYVNP
jgi:hypothetical protein